MSVFTPAEVRYLSSQSIARLATASSDGLPDVAAVGFSLDGDDIVSGGLDLTKTVRYRHLSTNPERRSSSTTWPAPTHSLPAGSRSEGPPPWTTPVGPSVSASAGTRSGAGGSTRAPASASLGSRSATSLRLHRPPAASHPQGL